MQKSIHQLADKIILLATAGYCWLLATVSVANAGLVPCGTSEHPESCTICHLFIGVHNIIDFLLFYLAIPLMIIALLYGGIVLLTSRGSEEQLKKGKKAVWLAVWGGLIAFAGWLLIDTILRGLVKGDFLPQFWNKFPSC